MLFRKSAGYLRQAGLSRLSGHLVFLVQSSSQDRPNRRDRRDRPNRPNRRASLAGLFSLLLVVLILGIAGTAQAQYGGSCRASAPPSRVPGTGFFEVVPSICVAERYDSNVYFRPATPGLQREDFVTTVNPRFRINHNGEYASVLLNLSGFNETYAKNSNLDFLGTRDSLFINLDNSIKGGFPARGCASATRSAFRSCLRLWGALQLGRRQAIPIFNRIPIFPGVRTFSRKDCCLSGEEA